MSRPVRPIEQMDSETLIKHFNARHVPYAGMPRVVARPSDPDETLLRRYHEFVHKQGTEDRPPRAVNHEHGFSPES